MVLMPCFARNSGERARGRGARGVQARQLAGLRIPVEDEQIAADAVHHRLHHGQHGVGGDGGVDRGASARQNLRRGLRGQRLAGGRDPLLRDHLRAAVVASLGGERGAWDQQDCEKPAERSHAG